MTDSVLKVVVHKARQQGGNVLVLDLCASDDTPLPAFEAGAHVDVHLPDGLVRQYSLCSDPADPGLYRLGVLKDPASRGGSEAVHATLREGSVVTISAPRNLFPLAVDAQSSLLIGGGIGITPMIAMAYALHAGALISSCTTAVARAVRRRFCKSWPAHRFPSGSAPISMMSRPASST